MNGYPVSLGQATHSLADTSARQTCVGRISGALYQCVTDPNNVIVNKHDFEGIREELALAIGRCYNDVLMVAPWETKGPVPVITNVAPFSSGIGNDLMSWYAQLYDCRTIEEMMNHVRDPCMVKSQKFYPPELYFGGYVMSHHSQAHPINGDTAVTLFIGGIITIKNGRFPVKGGDKMQWYFEEEADRGAFDAGQDGLRSVRDVNEYVCPPAGPAEELRGNGTYGPDGDLPPGGPSGPEVVGTDRPPQGPYQAAPLDPGTFKVKMHTYGERAKTRHPIWVKSCRPGLDGRGATIMDYRRVFGVAVLDAGPFELVDIKVSRQSH